MKQEKNRPFVFSEECELEDLGNGVKRRILSYGDKLMHVEVHFEEGAKGTIHSHPHTQTTYIIEGKFEFTIGNEKKIVKKGDTLYNLPNISHGCICLKKGVLLDTFTPMREDFLYRNEKV